VRKNLVCIFLLAALHAAAQPPDSLQAQRVLRTRSWLVGSTTAAASASSFILLNKAWYRDYPRSPFHSFNDAGEWNQVDKAGHSWTAYSISRATSGLWKWAGVNDRTSSMLGTGTSLRYLLSIEYLDGRSTEWGWSWADVGADVFGAGLFLSQQQVWKEQRVQLKFSAHKTDYDAALHTRADDLFGRSLPERLLKDYNAQSYWLSFNLSSFMPAKKLPRWLNIAVGYGAGGMFGGYENLARDKNGTVTFDRRDIKRYRQWYLAPDIDLTKIRTGSKLIKTILFAANALKFPAPALEFSNGRFHGKWLQF
jgi:uncharacterized protein YfiM (DUF2279 family)